MRAGHTNVQERCGWVQECGGCRTPKNTVEPSFLHFLSRLGSADNIEHAGCTPTPTFLGGHWHKWVVATMGNILPNNQPQAAALGMVINNSEVDTLSTLTQMSTSDGKCNESSNRGGEKSVPHKIMDNFSQTQM